ncbi:glycosyl transferase family 2 [Candidatus Gastranaerophilus sp. (ex Termes propinquus)]|nr:glycosyl transferase family 2 [Candidatus Gastranaerophilus sp. (ex Termes propinquus)]
MTLISVLMPVYNTREEYLRTAIESILNQTHSDLELIIVDDGSKNNATEVVLSYVNAGESRIRLYRNETNQGLPKTRNRLFDLACGEFVALMDSDDISDPFRLEKQLDFLRKNEDITIVGTGTRMFHPDKAVKSSIHIHPPRVKFLDFMIACCITTASTMSRKSNFEKYGLRYDENFKFAMPAVMI